MLVNAMPLTFFYLFKNFYSNMFCLLSCGCFYKFQLEEKASILISASFLLLHLDV